MRGGGDQNIVRYIGHPAEVIQRHANGGACRPHRCKRFKWSLDCNIAVCMGPGTLSVLILCHMLNIACSWVIKKIARQVGEAVTTEHYKWWCDRLSVYESRGKEDVIYCAGGEQRRLL